MLAKHYTVKELLRLKRIYDKADLNMHASHHNNIATRKRNFKAREKGY
jgi:hypothetical protein